MAIPTRTLGSTEIPVTALGLGGEGVLRTHGRDREAHELIRRAVDLGITYFESARAYAGSEQYLGRGLGGDRQRVFLATKTHHRTARGARAHLDESLALLQTTWLDLWYLHDLRSQRDLDQITGPGGALETVEAARRAGQVRLVGISGHESPQILGKALELYPFQVILLPVNPAEACADSFAAGVLPEAARRGLGVVAMKTLCRGLVTRLPGFAGPGPFLHYALSTPGVSTLSVGCDSSAQLEQNVAAVEAFAPLPAGPREALEQLTYPAAGELLYYRPR
ncbi:MAG: aldo/keto reductase [Deferrisomatales bacterium]|nr:aldo/keto reductase [Deferrisomatales bacterium]